MKHYAAPWGTLLIVISSLATALLVGATVLLEWNNPGMLTWLASLPLAIVLGAALFAIRGYTVAPDALLVHRLFWTTRLPLAGLQSVRYEPDAMRRSVKTMGNGGLFSFSGFYYNKSMGYYRAFVTDLHRTVVLRFATRTVAVSPSDPEGFVRDLAAATRH
jgi:hypothetical protein